MEVRIVNQLGDEEGEAYKIKGCLLLIQRGQWIQDFDQANRFVENGVNSVFWCHVTGRNEVIY